MKFSAALMIAAVLCLSTDAEARRKKKRTFEGTFAYCSVRNGRGELKGSTIFKQRDQEVLDDGSLGDLKPVKVASKWANLESEEDHTLSLFDDDIADCAGTALGVSLGDGFTTDVDGYGKLYGKFDTISLTGDDSIAGKYL